MMPDRKVARAHRCILCVGKHGVPNSFHLVRARIRKPKCCFVCVYVCVMSCSSCTYLAANKTQYNRQSICVFF